MYSTQLKSLALFIGIIVTVIPNKALSSPKRLLVAGVSNQINHAEWNHQLIGYGLSQSNIKEKISSLIKELPESTSSEDIEELIDFLYVKKQVLEGLTDFKQVKSYSLEEMKQVSEKWKSESQKRQSDS